MEIPKYIYRNLENFHNCSLPNKLVESEGIENLENKLNCVIEKREAIYVNGYKNVENVITYVASKRNGE